MAAIEDLINDNNPAFRGYYDYCEYCVYFDYVVSS